MKTLGKITALIVGAYDLVITVLVAYHFWGLTGVIGAILVPISLLIAPVVVYIDSANPVPLAIVLVGSTVSWLMMRDWDSSSRKESKTGLEYGEDGTLFLRIRESPYKQPAYASMQVKTLDDVKKKLQLAMQYSSAAIYESEFSGLSENDINMLPLEKLYVYASARMHFVSEIYGGEIMMFGDGPDFSLVLPVLSEFEKWHNRLFRAEQGLRAIPVDASQLADKISPEYHSELARIIGDLSNLRDTGAISEKEFQAKKTEILSRM